MLTRLETAYLGLLRVVVLIAATIALLIAALGSISAIPPLLRWSGITETQKPNGGTLRDFIDEQRITETTSEAPTATETSRLVLPDVKAAARTIKTYLGRRSATPQSQWESGIQDLADQLPGREAAYGESVRELTSQLLTSKGKALSEARIAQLVDWHKSRFEGEIQRRAATEAEGIARFWLTVASAGGAFLAFILIVFIFLFVRIERSLRLVRVSHEQPPQMDEIDA